MFGLFSKKDKGVKVVDKIWISDEAKFHACVEFSKNNQNIIFIAWFDETKSALQAYFQKNNVEQQVYLADYLSSSQANKEFLFVEHHPLSSEEQRIATEFGKDEITVLSSLSEPIFQLFGGDRIVDLMRKMGLKEDEMIEHNMISSSIKSAQEKIASKTLINGSARSQADWLLNAGVNQ
ncbi:preprotein translocase subunit SecA [Pedobacter nototheniae]|uniref:preprotein translocase subunit SecA n=1 Tax=Pedobacter nototheniae TaxID=2488994 RepID=UPI0010401141|nr:preprotein translocase subunit SecA [Pedobacter nototheniae]